MNTTNGKIAEQSRKKIINALFTVMKQYDFKEITITQIVQEASLSRKTFYRLFSSKEDVLNNFFESIYKEFMETIKTKEINSYWKIVQEYFDFWEEYRELLLLLKRNNLLYLLSEKLYSHSISVFETVRTKQIAEYYSVPLPYLLAFSVGGMHSMLVKWIENEMTIPSSLLIENLKNGFQSSQI